MVTGKWKDIGKVQGSDPAGACRARRTSTTGRPRVWPMSSRSTTRRFRLQLTDREKADLIAFLRSL